MLLVVCNYNPVLRESYSMGVPNPGTYKELINSDDVKYGGTGVKNGSVKSVKGPMHGFDQHIEVTLPPLSTIYFSVPAARKKAGKPAKAETAEAAKPNYGKRNDRNDPGWRPGFAPLRADPEAG